MNLFKINRIFLLCIFFICSISCTPQSIESIKNNANITTKGMLTMTGNHPFENISIYIPKYKTTLRLTFKFKEDKDIALKKIGHQVKINGTFKIDTKTLANSNKSIPFYSILVTKIKLK